MAQENISIPAVAQDRIKTLVENGVFKNVQSFTDTAITQFLNDFDHAKVNPKKASKCKFRVICKSIDELKADLQDRGVKSPYDVVLVDYVKVVGGNDLRMHNSKTGRLNQVFEIDLFEENSNFENGEEYIL